MSAAYGAYREARDLSWEILLRHHVSRLPVQVSPICRAEGIGLYSYERAAELIRCYGLEENCRAGDGFTFRRGESYVIVYDSTATVERQRFTVAHELGHCLLGHLKSDGATQGCAEPSDRMEEMQLQANVFASRLLAPACVLRAAGVRDARDIARLCGISLPAAQWRWQRLQLLEDRERQRRQDDLPGCYGASPRERQVLAQFSDYLSRLAQSPSSEP
ncbi:MAG: ImmA/IrrE family metallo-endopeptidase [Firmicutes bacterium]|nr:ImmA/IrrE family metallo-endopeptidase [Bacillota bacterium]MDY2719438.1 ImmA/IrrE family metallo-endopeptidase [Candidatus Faecousia sp.]